MSKQVFENLTNFDLRYIWTTTDTKKKKTNINPLNTKRSLLYLMTQFVPHSKHSISVIKTNQFML